MSGNMEPFTLRKDLGYSGDSEQGQQPIRERELRATSKLLVWGLLVMVIFIMLCLVGVVVWALLGVKNGAIGFGISITLSIMVVMIKRQIKYTHYRF